VPRSQSSSPYSRCAWALLCVHGASKRDGTLGVAHGIAQRRPSTHLTVFLQICQHLRNYTEPSFQRYIIRIIFMVRAQQSARGWVELSLQRAGQHSCTPRLKDCRRGHVAQLRANMQSPERCTLYLACVHESHHALGFLRLLNCNFYTLSCAEYAAKYQHPGCCSSCTRCVATAGPALCSHVVPCCDTPRVHDVVRDAT
jgi:hypothetical protein